MIFFPLNTSKKSGYWAVAAAIVLTAGLILLERNISVHRSLIVFYLVPIFLATWFAGPKAGLLMALGNIAGLAFANIPEIRGLYYKPVFFYINVMARACFMFFTVFLLTKLKSSMMKEQELLERVNEQNEELKKLNDRKSTFVANVSHELRGPLGIIRESLALILEKMAGEVNPEQQKILEMGKHNTERLIRLVKDLLDLSQIEAGKMKLKEEKIDLGALVEEVSKPYEKRISGKGLSLKKEIQPDLGVVLGDRDKMAQVVTNLLSNALKYTSRGGITIRLAGSGTEVRFEIADTGPGIQAVHLGKVFDKFERIMTETQEGTGLGLSIVKDIVELHKGKIWVESEPGKGSKFIFTLPRNTAAQ